MYPQHKAQINKQANQGHKKPQDIDLLDRAKNLNDAEKLRQLSMKDLRNYISMLTVELFFKERFKGRKPRGIWLSKTPDGWPSHLAFTDPHNKGKDGHKPQKHDLLPIMQSLVWTFLRQNDIQPTFAQFSLNAGHPIKNSEESDDCIPECSPQPINNPSAFVSISTFPCEVSDETTPAGIHPFQQEQVSLVTPLQEIMKKIILKYQELDKETKYMLDTSTDNLHEYLEAVGYADSSWIRPLNKVLHDVDFLLDCIRQNTFSETDIPQLNSWICDLRTMVLQPENSHHMSHGQVCLEECKDDEAQFQADILDGFLNSFDRSLFASPEFESSDSTTDHQISLSYPEAQNYSSQDTEMLQHPMEVDTNGLDPDKSQFVDGDASTIDVDGGNIDLHNFGCSVAVYGEAPASLLSDGTSAIEQLDPEDLDPGCSQIFSPSHIRLEHSYCQQNYKGVHLLRNDSCVSDIEMDIS